MITEKEKQATLLSPTKKDFYQIWEELLSTARKLSERWDPTSTNEADPGIILLKVLTACADKLNYSIDKNILEAFMPSASQEESMRKLCSMLGYSMKYYRSATTTAIISYIEDEENIPDEGIEIPAFTNLKNEDDTINYITLKGTRIIKAITSQTVPVMEGSLQICESDTDNIISINMLDDNQRYYLPETQIAENGIFIYNINDGTQTMWKQVSNLNVQTTGSKVYKFGFDSRQGIPYIQFPEDISILIEDGIFIYYVRTSGTNGNISPRTLSSMEKPQLWSNTEYKDLYENITPEMFSIDNGDAAKNGADKESIEDAYNNFKKTIGTFDTLVTCRDYMNKIYQLTVDENNTTPLVSNVIVSDIRDDINNSFTLCSFNEYGICYSDNPVLVDREITGKDKDGNEHTITTKEPRISNFNLMLYPFKTVKGLNTKTEYDNSFKFTDENVTAIKNDLENYKTISHVFKVPDAKATGKDLDIICIKNYLKLDAKITTVQKVNAIEEKLIIENIKTAIYERFNSRKLDFGEEIPYDDILECMENADEKIKNVSLMEPTLYTKFLMANGKEYWNAAAFPENSNEETITDIEAKKTYNKLALRNILAGKVALFNYDTSFTFGYDEVKYPGTTIKPIYPEQGDTIVKLESNYTINTEDAEKKGITLNDNEIIQFRRLNFRTVQTYPAYVNYFLKLNRDAGAKDAKAASFISLEKVFTENETEVREDFINFVNKGIDSEAEITPPHSDIIKLSYEIYENYADRFLLYTKKTDGKHYTHIYPTEKWEDEKIFYIFKVSKNLRFFKDWIWHTDPEKKPEKHIIPGQARALDSNKLYRQLATDTTRLPGKYVDESGYKYMEATTSTVSQEENDYKYFFIPFTRADNDPWLNWYTVDGLGEDGEITHFKKDQDYQLKDGEYLLFNYTQTERDEDGNETGSKVINRYYGKDTVIKSATLLADSTEEHEAGVKYNKTENFLFSTLKNEGNSSDKETFSQKFGQDPEGLYTLGVDDKIEIREPAIVSLWNEDKQQTIDDVCYLYFILNEEKVGNDGYIEFPFEEAEKIDENDTYAYTLKEGEYLFYTNKNKLDVAYYGNGTVVRVMGEMAKSFKLKKSADDENVSEDDINEKGISAIPWISKHFSKNAYIVIEENQYISLIKGDTLKSFELGDVNKSNETVDSKTWVKVKKFTYQLQGKDNTTITSDDLRVGGRKVTWRMRPKLEINIGPATGQTLNEGDELTLTIKKNNGDTEQITLKGEEVKDQETEETKFVPLTVKTNYYALTGSGELNTQKNLYNIDGMLVGTDEEPIKDFMVKAYEEKPVVTEIGGELINLNNYGGGGWTKLSLGLNQTEDRPYTTLHANVPSYFVGDKRYGLAMMYYVTSLSDEDILYKKGANLDVPEGKSLSIFNNGNVTEMEWWKDLKEGTRYYLRKGLNIVKIDESFDIGIFSQIQGDKSSQTDVLIFSDLSIINANDSHGLGIDLENLCYKQVKENVNASAQLLEDIKEYDTNFEFYYNGPIDNSTAIDLNRKAEENLETPYAWYDYNNANNKFVISEIDSDYLDRGIMVAKSSRLY